MRLYSNADLVLYDHRLEDGREVFLVRMEAPAGQQKHAQATRVPLPAGVRSSVDRLEDGALDAAELIELGRKLGDALLPQGLARELFTRSLDDLGEDQGLRLRLQIEEPALAALPWELAHLPLPGMPDGQADRRGFLCLRADVSLTRYEQMPQSIKAFPPVRRPRLVLLSSNPELPGTERLDLTSERDEIAAAAAKAEIETVSPETSTLVDLRRTLEDGAHLFHFGGHGTFSEGELGEIPRTAEGTGYLLFEDGKGGPNPVPADEVAISLLRSQIRVVVLNSCYSGRRDAVRAWTGVGPVLVHEGLPAVVANQFRIEDRSAIAFARAFYEQIARGRPIDSAVAAGRLAILDLDPETVADWSSFVLYLRLDDKSDGVVFPRPADEVAEGDERRLSRLFWANLGLAAVSLAAAMAVSSRWLEPRLPPSWLTFGGFGLLGLAALVWAFLKFVAEDPIRMALRRALGARAATAVAAGVLVAAGAVAWLVPVPVPPVLILPFVGINEFLPRVDKSPGLCSLEALDADSAARLWEVEHVARQAIVVGATADGLRDKLEDDELKQQIDSMLLEELPDGGGAGWVDLWFQNRRFEPELSWGRASTVTLRLVKPDAAEPVWESAPQKLSHLGGTAIKTWLLRADNESTPSTNCAQ